MASVPNPPMASQPPPGPTGHQDPPAGWPGNGPLIALTAASVLFLVGSIALLGFAVSQVGSSGSGDVIAVDESSAGGTTGSPQADDTSPERTTTTRRATTTTQATAPSGPLTPTSVDVTNTREPVGELACTDEYMSYDGQQLIDGDDQLGWGASANDGSGQRAIIEFGQSVELTSVGLLPGYAREAPHSKAGCSTVSAFPLNRQVQSVRWTFDDGSSVQQDFDATPEMQRHEVDVTTSSVTLEILSTVQPSGADSDTIISEAAFEGRG